MLFKSTTTIIKSFKNFPASLRSLHCLILMGFLPLSSFLLEDSVKSTIDVSHSAGLYWLILLVSAVLFIALVNFESRLLVNSLKTNQTPKEPTSRLIQRSLKELTVKNSVVLAYFFLLALPFLSPASFFSLLQHLPLSSHLIDSIFFNRIPVVAGLVAVYLVLWILGIVNRYLHVKRKYPQILVRQLVKLGFRALGTSLLFYLSGFLIFFFFQKIMDLFLPSFSLLSASLTVGGLKLLGFYCVEIFLLSCLLNFWLSTQPKTPERSELSSKPLLKALPLLLLAGSLFFLTVTNYQLFSTAISTQPILIAHRGVTNHNGLQNSTAALQQTTLEKPEYVEIDLQLTEDQQFVVFHDFDLAGLAGVAGNPRDFTLAQLQQIPLTEGTFQEQMVSFDDYLKLAESNNQKLLIELKSLIPDTQPLVDLFLQKYQTILQTTGSQLQSMRLSIVEELKQAAPELTVGYIMPFTLGGIPKSSADFYSVSYLTITPELIERVHLQHKKIFVWTTNQQSLVARMNLYGVDGLITDNLAVSNDGLEETPVSYSQQLFFLSLGIA